MYHDCSGFRSRVTGSQSGVRSPADVRSPLFIRRACDPRPQCGDHRAVSERDADMPVQVRALVEEDEASRRCSPAKQRCGVRVCQCRWKARMKHPGLIRDITNEHLAPAEPGYAIRAGKLSEVPQRHPRDYHTPAIGDIFRRRGNRHRWPKQRQPGVAWRSCGGCDRDGRGRGRGCSGCQRGFRAVRRIDRSCSWWGGRTHRGSGGRDCVRCAQRGRGGSRGRCICACR